MRQQKAVKLAMSLGMLLIGLVGAVDLLAQSPTIKWSTTLQGGTCFSSINQYADLNADGISDLVVGGSREGGWDKPAIFALDGKNGNLLWQRSAPNQIYLSARFTHINGDSIPDVLIGGRDAQLLALNGRNGELLWQFWSDTLPAKDSGWYNFYNLLLIPDINNDQIEDILISNGGDANAVPSDTNRPAGSILILSGQHGEVLGRIKTPDQHETYFAPLLLPDQKTVLFGTGGETIGGGLYLIPLSDLIQSDTSNIQPITYDSEHGFIAAPTIVRSSTNDVLAVPRYHEEFELYNINTPNQPAYQFHVKEANTEAYVTPVPGFFNRDNVVDYVQIFAKGIFPFYSGYIYVVIDGANGQVIDRWESSGIYQLNSCNVLDLDNDGLDELLIAHNYDNGTTRVQYRTSFMVKQFEPDTLYYLFGDRPGITLYSQPAFYDLDHNNQLDMLVVTNLNEKNWYTHDSFSVARYEWNQNLTSVNWPCYMGMDGKAQFDANQSSHVPSNIFSNLVKPYPNPVDDVLYFGKKTRYELYTSNGALLKTGHSASFNTTQLPDGIYLVHLEGELTFRRIVVLHH
ncbi:MAG: T9SS type A sorting domain-containing protein [Bacteroidetes bacterium]|nr:T9SS type A sorting domain-containing protein [Bacteroidota bacterium]